MDWKKIGKKIIYPPLWLMILLIPSATIFLVCSMIFLGTESVVAIISYVISAYTLTVWCFKIPCLITFFKTLKNENKYLIRWREDPRLRVNISLFASIFINSAFAVFQFCLGIKHGSFWFYSLAAYYLCLASMRFFLFRYTKKHHPGERMRSELLKYRNCGWVFLVINLMLSVIVLFMIRFDRTFIHHEITTIAIAAYTFTSLTLAIINIVKFRKYNSPAFLTSKAISLAAACVSMLTLESTMLTTFGNAESDASMRRVLLAITGGVISLFLILTAIYMIVESTKKLRLLKSKELTDAEQ